jgi:hypothetical protein
LVLPLSLTVRLWVECGPQAVIDTEVGAKSVPKYTGKLFAASDGDIYLYALLVDHMFKEHSC